MAILGRIVGWASSQVTNDTHNNSVYVGTINDLCMNDIIDYLVLAPVALLGLDEAWNLNWSNRRKLHGVGAYRRIGQPWTMTSYLEVFGIIMRKALCRKWPVCVSDAWWQWRALTYNNHPFIFCGVGERYVYKFVCDPEALFNMAYGSNSCSDGQSSPISNCRNSSLTTSMVGHNGTSISDRNIPTYYNNYQ